MDRTNRPGEAPDGLSQATANALGSARSSRDISPTRRSLRSLLAGLSRRRREVARAPHTTAGKVGEVSEPTSLPRASSAPL